jgi:hypothetical protein
MMMVMMMMMMMMTTTMTFKFGNKCWCIKKLKESRKRPGVAQMVPGGLDSQISRHSARECREVVSLTRRLPLLPGMFLVLIFTRGWVNPRATVRSEGGMLMKNSLTPPEIDPCTVRLVAQSLNHYATPGPNKCWCMIVKMVQKITELYVYEITAITTLFIFFAITL